MVFSSKSPNVRFLPMWARWIPAQRCTAVLFGSLKRCEPELPNRTQHSPSPQLKLQLSVCSSKQMNRRLPPSPTAWTKSPSPGFVFQGPRSKETRRGSVFGASGVTKLSFRDILFKLFPPKLHFSSSLYGTVSWELGSRFKVRNRGEGCRFFGDTVCAFII